MTENFEKLPMIALRGLSVFPAMILNFDIERPISVAALDQAMEGERRIFLLAQRDADIEEPEERDLYHIGCVAYVRQILRMPGGAVRVLVEGKSRAQLNRIIAMKPWMEAAVELIPEEADLEHVRLREALMRRTRGLVGHMRMLLQGNGPVSGNVDGYRDPGALADFLAQNMHIPHEKKQTILETVQPLRRLEKMNEFLEYEIEVLEVESQLHQKTQGRMMAAHRESILREQMRTIQQELGMDEEQEAESEYDEYRSKIEALPASDEVKEKLRKELSRLNHQGMGSSEGAVLRTYLDKVLELPWGKYTEDDFNVEKTRRILDEDHYGLQKVKERILEFVAVKQLAPDMKGAILCLVGPPGTGKTSIGISIARAMGRKLSRISLGGVHDEAEIRGHRKTYVGAMPGRIMNAMAQAGSANPVLLLDEVDKLGTDYRGDPSSALLEALDSEQNYAFRDHYLEVPFDLSNVVFITTANTTSSIPRPLLDRMEVIELSSYTDEEKLHIAKDHLLPKQREKHGIKARQLRVSDAALRAVITGWTQESGVRTLERELGAICRKAAVRLVEEGVPSVTVPVKELESFLGVRKYKPEEKRREDTVGLARGLAWTSVGGVTLDVEVAVIEGTGMLRLTGNLGEVMKESAAAGMGYIRSRAELLGIDPAFHRTKDILVHFPEGAVPKDGPSAGITMTLAMISALTGARVRGNIAMTGEITLRGRVLAIGGLKEKTMAALRAGADTVIIPKENEPDLAEIDQDVRARLKFITASHIDDVLHLALDFTGVRPWRPEPKPQNLMPAAPAEPDRSPERTHPN
ncbi:MAG: endopeptidase La [Oscillospiraceae bacterium]|nr:endopeptidase La [Oscillospiraceae bacterium]MBR4691314.1 endopeptidase La [Oscillospiraceae bacterium]